VTEQRISNGRYMFTVYANRTDYSDYTAFTLVIRAKVFIQV